MDPLMELTIMHKLSLILRICCYLPIFSYTQSEFCELNIILDKFVA
jgi:hypothetical protein